MAVSRWRSTRHDSILCLLEPNPKELLETMSAISTKPPSGMRDFLPDSLARRRHVVSIVERVYESYGFVPIETPTIENLSTLLGKYGEEGDQLLYRVLKRRDSLTRALDSDEVTERDLAEQGLRYDLTVPLARVVAQHGRLPKFFKRYQIQPVWRADRPGKGRFREFYQCDVDVCGTKSLVAEAEVCGAVAEVLRELGFEDFTIHLNHRQLLRQIIAATGIDASKEETALVAIDKLDKIGEDGVLKELDGRGVAEPEARKLLEIIETDEGASSDDIAERLKTFVTSETGVAAIDELLELLELAKSTAADGHLTLSPALARGLGYYTGPIFEISVADLAGSLGGGGRYDDLVGMFGKQQIPAVGFSIGLERILLVMEERGMYPELVSGPEVMLCWMGVSESSVLGVARQLRSQGLRVEVYPQSAKLGKQLQYADSQGVGAPVAAIVGEDELQSGEVTLKHLESGDQERLPIDRAAEFVRGGR